MHKPRIPLHELPQDKGNNIRLERILPASDPVNNSVHRHAYHELFLFKKGSGVHMIDLEHIPFQAPCIHFVAPGQVHKLDRSADTDGYVVMFTKDVQHGVFIDPRIRAILRAGAAGRSFTLDQDCLKEALRVVEIIEQEQQDQATASTSVLENLMAILLLKCLRWSQLGRHSTLPDRSNDVVERFLEKVDQEFLTKRQVNAYATDLAISAGHLNELVKKRLGRNASDILNDRLLLEAKRLLLHADLTIKEVCYALEMEDPAYFTRMFKKATSMTPGEFRELTREKYQR